jgi:tetratricopeptide (TPR) repeat protein
MDDRLLPLIYLGVLVILLGAASWFIFRQVWRSRRTELTMSRLQKKLTQEKGTAQEYYELGGILLDKRLYSQAIALFQKAMKAKDLEGEENRALLFNALGYAYAAQDQFDLAIKHYKEAVELLPSYSTAYNNLGFAYEKKQLTAPALEAYEAAIAADAKNAIARRRAESLRKRLVPSSK